MPGTVPDDIVAAVRSRRELLDDVSARLHEQPETRFEEHQAAALLGDHLAAGGFAVENGTGGLPTAFVGSHGSGAPTVAVLLEYDALPGLGHGCGHNLIAAGGLVAGLAVAAARPGHPGTLLVIGTPGEEGGGGKVRLLDAGVFDPVDAAVMFHPGDRNLAARHSLAVSHLRFTFRGIAAHAAREPWEGRSAAAGVQVFQVAVDALRQFIRPTARIHGVVSFGGAAPNVVPDRAEVDLYVRDVTSAGLDDLLERVRAAAEGAAIATGTTVSQAETAPRYAERVMNATMADRFADHAAALGLPMSRPGPDEPAGSSDIGNVSVVLPVIHPYVQIAPRGTPSHSDAMREAAATTTARDATETAAAAMAALVVDLLEDPVLLAAARAELAG